jgi:two-component system, OmpR family, alkaline phosphatase synthesis response regulator PhoP
MARVLVIDDDPDVLLLCRVNLAHAGHEVLMALDAERGLEIVRTEQPDVIVLDLMLPRRDGFDVMEELTADGTMQEVPVLLLTARAGWEDRVRGLQAGATEYLTKPFAPAALTDALLRAHTMSAEERQASRAAALRDLLNERG